MTSDNIFSKLTTESPLFEFKINVSSVSLLLTMTTVWFVKSAKTIEANAPSINKCLQFLESFEMSFDGFLLKLVFQGWKTSFQFFWIRIPIKWRSIFQERLIWRENSCSHFKRTSQLQGMFHFNLSGICSVSREAPKW